MKRLLLLSLFVVFISGYSQSQTELWGMTPSGGYDAGVIFKTNENGDSMSVIQPFDFFPGKSPKYTKLCEADNGKLYGMTTSGGPNDNGIIFEYDPVTNSYSRIFDFDGSSSGRAPNGSLIKASNGKLYGMTTFGGSNNNGVLFEFDPNTNIFVKKFDFSQPTGMNPYGSLLQASNGKLYGMTANGGSTLGTIFEFDPITNVFVKKKDFNTVCGASPIGSLIQATNGKLYGMTPYGGEGNNGVIFEYDINLDSLRPMWYYTNSSVGSHPFGSLLQASNGKLYGTTSAGGSNSDGTIFEFDIVAPSYTYFSLEGYSGRMPVGSLIEANNGKLYGMTVSGGSSFSNGVIFEIDPATFYLTIKAEFDAVLDGAYPYGSLTQTNNGNIYGLTNEGGSCNYGVLFEFDTLTNSISKKIDFSGASEGSYPYGSLIQASTGKLYGLTCYGGEVSNNGVLFEYDMSTSTIANKIEFSTPTNGQFPDYSSLVEWSNGKLYGTTSGGGSGGYGVLFEYDPATNSYIKKVNFGGTKGEFPTGKLLIATNGKIYGTTLEGGDFYNTGVLFEYDPSTNICNGKIEFIGTSNGSSPYGSLIQSANGKIYGMTSSGGANGYGTIFEYDPAANIYVKKLDFAGVSNGRVPRGSLMEASNGMLYGLTCYGGVNNDGVLFEYNPTTSSYTKKLDFDSATTGCYPFGSLLESINGKLYAMTQGGGAYDKGVLFEFDLTTGICTKKFDFNYTNGANPFADLVLVYSPPQFTCYIPNSVVPQYSNASFIVSATGNGLSYQWQINDGSKGFVDLSNDATYDGVTDDTLRLTSVDCSMNYNRYRCEVTSTHPLMSIVSNEATLITTSNTYNESMEICDGETYLWQGAGYSVSGNYQASYQNVSGCDSIYFLQLVVHPSSSFLSNQDICEGEIFNWRGTDYFTTGIYQDSLLSASGCDSVFILYLSVHSPTMVEIVGLDSVYCLYNSPDSISGNLAGGVFSGQGVSGTVFNPTIAGIGSWPIAYLYTDSFGCESSDTINVVVDACLGMNEAENSYHIYPNPAIDKLTIELPDAGNYTISLINVMGQIVLVQQVSGHQQTEINLFGFSQDVYTLKIENSEGFVLKRVVVER